MGISNSMSLHRVVSTSSRASVPDEAKCTASMNGEEPIKITYIPKAILNPDPDVKVRWSVKCDDDGNAGCNYCLRLYVWRYETDGNTWNYDLNNCIKNHTPANSFYKEDQSLNCDDTRTFTTTKDLLIGPTTFPPGTATEYYYLAWAEVSLHPCSANAAADAISIEQSATYQY